MSWLDYSFKINCLTQNISGWDPNIPLPLIFDQGCLTCHPLWWHSLWQSYLPSFVVTFYLAVLPAIPCGDILSGSPTWHPLWWHSLWQSYLTTPVVTFSLAVLPAIPCGDILSGSPAPGPAPEEALCHSPAGCQPGGQEWASQEVRSGQGSGQEEDQLWRTNEDPKDEDRNPEGPRVVLDLVRTSSPGNAQLVSHPDRVWIDDCLGDWWSFLSWSRELLHCQRWQSSCDYFS